MGIDLKAGGKSKKTKRTAPKSQDIYLKLLVKAHLSLFLSHFLSLSLCVYICMYVFIFKSSNLCVLLKKMTVDLCSAVPFSCEEDGKQVQCCDTEEVVHEQGQ
ncbi:hypothetical protein CsSME_00006253 [Camellia sinensis var. sinensis]